MTTYHTAQADDGTFQVLAEDAFFVKDWDSPTLQSEVPFEWTLVADVTEAVAESWQKVFEAASTPPRPLEEILDSEWRRW